jgi:hypothetical protein
MSAEYKYGLKASPGHGGMRCSCCTQTRPKETKRRINREFRRKQRLQLKGFENE